MQLAIKELLKIWDLRQYKTSLQKATMEAFGKIHDLNINEMIEFLQSVISNLPTNQSDTFDIQSCYPGFLAWNEFWKQSYSRENVDGKLEALANVHKYYENWIKKSQPEENMPFQELWEVVMIRVGSEAMCETVGSIMVQHGAKNRILQPENFNTEMVLRFNLGPLHHSDGLIAEILAFDATKIYVRKGNRLDKITSQDVNKVPPLPPLKNLMRKSLVSLKNFGIPAPNNVKLYDVKIVLFNVKIPCIIINTWTITLIA